MHKQISVEDRLRQSNTRLKNTNKKLRERIKFLEEENARKDRIIETLMVRIADLEKSVYGSKKTKFPDDDNSGLGSNLRSFTKEPVIRDSSSYRRPTPSNDEITKEEKYTINACPDCGSFLIKKQTTTRFIEDILLPYFDEILKRMVSPCKTVTKQSVEKGYCPKCQCWHSSIPSGSSPPFKNNEVLLGSNIRKYIAYKTTITNSTYQKIKDELLDLYNITLSDGEIAGILERTANKLSPEKARIKKRIQEEKAKHIDETSGQRGNEKNYTWAMASVKTNEVIFEVGKNRGKGNAEKLLGDNINCVIITDFYAAYKNLPGKHQVCWIHFIRKPKELAMNSNLSKDKRDFAAGIYNDLIPIYEKVKSICQSKFDLNEREKYLPKLKAQLNKVLKKIDGHKDNPKKLTDFSKLAKKYINELFTCITENGVPCENNKAERIIRPLVIKRKISFGTKSEKGDNIFSVNASVLFSLWYQNRSNFWPRFHELMAWQ